VVSSMAVSCDSCELVGDLSLGRSNQLVQTCIAGACESSGDPLGSFTSRGRSNHAVPVASGICFKSSGARLGGLAPFVAFAHHEGTGTLFRSAKASTASLVRQIAYGIWRISSAIIRPSTNWASPIGLMTCTPKRWPFLSGPLVSKNPFLACIYNWCHRISFISLAFLLDLAASSVDQSDTSRSTLIDSQFIRTSITFERGGQRQRALTRSLTLRIDTVVFAPGGNYKQ